MDNLSIYLSLIVAIALFSFSNQVSDLLGTNDFSAELKVASVCIIFIGLSTIPHSALLKNLNFSEIAKIHLFATTFGYFFVGSGLAYLGFQGLGLVIGIAAQEFILMLMCRRAYPRNNLHSFHIYFDKKLIKNFWLNVLANFLNFLGTQGDKLDCNEILANKFRYLWARISSHVASFHILGKSFRHGNVSLFFIKCQYSRK